MLHFLSKLAHRLGERIALTEIKRPESSLHNLFLFQVVPDSFQIDPEKSRKFSILRYWRRLMYRDEWDSIRIEQFMHLIEHVNKLPNGDYIELGTQAGASAHIIWELMSDNQRLYCFDTFEGFKEEDLAEESKLYKHAWTTDSIKPSPIERVRETITGGLPSDLLKLIPGRVPMSLAGYENHQWRFAHLDMDLYEPTKEAIKWLWPRIVPGGIMVFHDYGCPDFPGIKKAVDDFFTPLGLMALPMGDRWGSGVIYKTWSGVAVALS